MNFIRIIIFLAVISPFMAALSGCDNDAFLDAIHEEEDFIAPFDVVLTDDDAALRTTYFKIPELNTIGNYTENPDADGNATAVIDGLDNVVADNITKLMWTRCTAKDKDTMDKTANCTESHSTMEWIYAVELCKIKMNSGSGYAGYKDWRLPRVPELTSLINFDSNDPVIDTGAFPNAVNSVDCGYWTFTSKLFIGDYFETIDNGWIVFTMSSWAQTSSFTNLVDFRRKQKLDLTYEKQYVRCVRGGIKDPK